MISVIAIIFIEIFCSCSPPLHQNPPPEEVLTTDHPVQTEHHRDLSQHIDPSLPKHQLSRKILSNKTLRILAADQLVLPCQELQWWKEWRVD